MKEQIEKRKKCKKNFFLKMGWGEGLFEKAKGRQKKEKARKKGQNKEGDKKEKRERERRIQIR